MNVAVEITTNQFQQNISIKLADDYFSTLLTGNVMKFSVDLKKINSEKALKEKVLIRHYEVKVSKQKCDISSLIIAIATLMLIFTEHLAALFEMLIL